MMLSTPKDLLGFIQESIFSQRHYLSLQRLTCCLFAFIAIPLTAGTVFSECVGDGIGILVKTSFTQYFGVADGDCNPSPYHMSSWDMLIDRFVAQSPAPSIDSPGSEPSHTPFPYTKLFGYFDSDGDEYLDAAFNFATDSLYDCGIYYCTLIGEFTDGYYLYDLIPASFGMEVVNWPPTTSPSISGPVEIGQTAELRANSEDNDYGMGSETASLSHDWEIIQPASPSASLASPHSRTTDIHFVDEDDIGNWQVRVRVVDNEGEFTSDTVSFFVPEIPPDVDILGDIDIDVLTDIHLWASRTDDLDGGPPLTFQWEILDAPLTHTVDLGTISTTNSELTIPTTGPECGVWQFQLTSRDNEHEHDDVDTVSVTVHNIFPEITVDGTSSLVVGETIHFEVSPTDDLDGGVLEITWDLIQSPDASIHAPGPDFETGSVLHITTGAAEAGTWIFDVHVFDDEDFEQGEFHSRIQVLVDAEPEAYASTPASTVSFLDPLSIDASASIDPDTDNPHTNIEGSPVLSGGITYYDWWITEMPYDAYGDYFPGPVDEVLGTANGLANLIISPGMLASGNWTFEVEVTDAEGNTDSTSLSVAIVDPDSAPAAFVLPLAAKYYTDMDGYLQDAIELNGCLSFDPDNLLHESYAPGLGIDSFSWSLLGWPSGCEVPHTLTDTCLTQLFPATSLLPPDCQGVWLPGLTVEDDESRFGYSAGLVFIGNCADHLCIDYPTTDNYEYVEFTDKTDITIYYHLDTSVYSDPAFDAGMRLELRIYHEDDPGTPAYSAHYDYDVLPTDRGGFLTFHWHGYTNDGMRPQPGKYKVEITATSPTDPAIVYQAAEDEAIWIEVLDVEILPLSDDLLSINGVKEGIADLSITFETTTYFTADEIYDYAQLIITPDGSTSAVYEGPVPDPLIGDVSWNGQLAPDIYISPGIYTAQIEVFKEGHSLGVSPEHFFVAYEFDCALDGIADTDEFDPGATIILGDTINATLTLSPSDGSVTGNISLELLDGVDVIEVSDAGTPVNIDGSPSFRHTDLVTPKVLTIEVVGTTNAFAELELCFEPDDAGASPKHLAADYIRVNSLEINLAADTDNNGSITGADDGAEDAFPGIVRWINADDDDGNTTLDLDDVGPVSGEQDLAEVEVHVGPSTLEGTITLSSPAGGANFKLWEDGEKGAQIALPHTYALGTDTIPESIYVEGYSEGQARLKLEYHDLSSTLVAEDEIYLTIINVDLDVDTNRDAIIDSTDETGEEAWSGLSGALGIYNNDNDDHLAGDTDIDCENDVIDGVNDEDDQSPLMIHRIQLPALPAGWRAVLSVPWHFDRLRVFNESGLAVIGHGLTDEYEIPNIVSSDLTYHVEFMHYAAVAHDPPEFTLRLTLYDATGEVFADNTKIRVAPFMLKSNIDPANELFVVNLPAIPESATFVADLTAIAGVIGVPLTVIDGALYGNDRWIQDEIEFGFSVTPTHEMETVLDSPRDRGLDDYPEDSLVSANLGFYTTGSASNTYNSFGNLECSPPLTAGGTYYPMGRMYYGENSTTGTGIDSDMQLFLQAQDIQSPVILNTGWLRVGHVDEMMAFIPYPGASLGDKNFKLLVASPEKALEILDLQPDHTVTIPKLGETIGHILTHDRLYNEACQLEIDAVTSDLTTTMVDAADIIEIPVLFREHPVSGQADALLPNMVNLISVNGHLIVAEPFFDPFKDAFNTRLQGVGFVPPGMAGENIHFIDDWDVYHVQSGEVHCGTNLRRANSAPDNWWDIY